MMRYDIEEVYELMKGRIHSSEEKALIEKASDFAEKAHKGQKRASGEPYFSHVFETAKNLARFGMDAKTISAGLLHDTIEDTETKKEELEKEFGQEVAFMVEGVSKLGKLKYRGRERYVESMRKFFVAVAEDFRVLVIKLSDRLHNLHTLEHIPKEKRKRIALEAIEVYAPLAHRFGIGKIKGELEDAAFPYVYPEEYKMAEEIIKNKINLSEPLINKLSVEIKKKLEDNGISVSEINQRLKHKYSLYRKLKRFNMNIENIYDIVAIRIIVGTVEQCYHTLGAIHSFWTPMPGRIKDYIALPKANGYQSLHTTIFTGDGGIAEVQIRTQDMHDRAEYGIAGHFSYKQSKYGKDGGKKENDSENLGWSGGFNEFRKHITEHGGGVEDLKMDFFKDRIFVFTPDGDVIDLPEDSSPIDFAYSIHSDVGNQTSGAKVNGKMVSLGHKLKNGDIVEVIKNKNAKPSAKWLDYAKTSMAKKRVHASIGKGGFLSRLKFFGK